MIAFLWSQSGQLIATETVRDPPPPAMQISIYSADLSIIYTRKFYRGEHGLVIDKPAESVITRGVDYIEDPQSPFKT